MPNDNWLQPATGMNIEGYLVWYMKSQVDKYFTNDLWENGYAGIDAIFQVQHRMDGMQTMSFYIVKTRLWMNVTFHLNFGGSIIWFQGLLSVNQARLDIWGQGARMQPFQHFGPMLNEMAMTLIWGNGDDATPDQSVKGPWLLMPEVLQAIESSIGGPLNEVEGKETTA